MILVSLDHLLEQLFVVWHRPQLCVRIQPVLEIQTHCRHFVDDDDTFLVAQAVHLFRIGIMAGAEGIGVEPVEKTDVFDIETAVRTSSPERRILMATDWVKSIPEYHLQKFIDAVDYSLPYPQSKKSEEWQSLERKIIKDVWIQSIGVDEAMHSIADQTNAILNK